MLLGQRCQGRSLPLTYVYPFASVARRRALPARSVETTGQSRYKSRCGRCAVVHSAMVFARRLHKLRAGLVRPDRVRIGVDWPVEVDEFVFRFNRRFHPMTVLSVWVRPIHLEWRLMPRCGPSPARQCFEFRRKGSIQDRRAKKAGH